MGGGEGSKGNLKNEDGEHVVGGLEPDPRYIRCCSKVCRPGYALRDALLGLLVLLGLSVIVTVIFVVCFYVVPDEKKLIDEGILSGTAEGVIRGPGGVKEITLQDGEKYTLPPYNFDDASGSSRDFNTFTTSTDDVFRDTTDRILPPRSENSDESASPDFTHSERVVDDESGSQHDLEPRENVNDHLPAEDSNTHHFNEHAGHEEGAHHNLGHQGERPVLEGEHGQFHRDDNTELPATPVGVRGNENAALPTDNNENTCSAVQLPMCVSSVPWTQSGHPNWLNHTSEEEMFAALPYVRSSLLDSGCSDLAPLYACSLLEPPCSDNAVLPPCRAVCAEVAESCHPFVQRTSLPGLFDCGRFPDSDDPSVCISAQQGGNTLRSGLIQPISSAISDSVENTTAGQNNNPSTVRSVIKTLTLNTGINFSANTENSVPTTNITVPPMDGLSTSNVASENSNLDVVPSTTMSLADRLKLAMSGDSSKTATERIQRHSNTPSLQSFITTTVASNENMNPTGLSLADRLSTVTNENVSRFNPTQQPVRSTVDSSRSTRNPFRPSLQAETETPFRARSQTGRSIDTTTATESDENTSAGPTGVMSLAELLALSNKGKPSAKPARRQPPRRRPTSNSPNRVTDQLSEASSDTTERVTATSFRTRFTENLNQNSPDHDNDDGERRIPVRGVDDVPKIKFSFPKRNPSSKPVPFRTTAEPPTVTTQSSEQETTTDYSTRAPVSKFVPSSFTTQGTTTVADLTTSTQSQVTVSTPNPVSTPVQETCPELQCLDGKCIAINQLNDGVVDCSDGSDEQDFGELVT